MAAADGSATFALDLDDSGATGAAKDAAGALEELRSKIDDDLGALKAMQQAMRNLQGGTAVNVQAFKKLKDQITAQKATIAASQEKYLSLGGSLKAVAKTGKDGGDGLKSFVDSAKAGGGPVGGMIERVSGLSKMLGKGGLAGAAILGVAAVVALTVALVAATVALGSYGIAQANAARAERLSLEGLTKIPNWYGLAADKASYLQESINSVSSSVALGRDKVAGYATELYKMGLRGQNLKDALEATSIASSAAGESYAGLVKGQLAGSAMMGQSVKKVADTIKARFGGVARAQMLDLNVQSAKLKENFGQIFAGLKIEGFLSALNMVTELFSQNTFTGKALKVIVETLFNPLIAGVELAGPIMKRFFQGMVIAALYFAIVVLTIRNKLRDTFGEPKLFKGIDWMKVGLYAGVVAGGLLITTLLGLGAALALVGAAIFISFLPLIIIFGLIGVAIAAVVVAFSWLAVKGKEAYQWVAGLDWGQLGTDLIDGLVDGITSGAVRVVNAVKNLAKGALAAAKGIWESHSPSKAWHRFGITGPQGMAGGIDDGTPLVEKSVNAMVSLPGEGPSPAGAAPGRSPGGGPLIAELHYHSSGKENHQADAEDFKTKLENTLRGVALRLAAAP